ncbi:sensor histidine kinase [Kaistia granuli]|uniref:sensor histidine kinase n=1 Tax=Kaistia granuli TaxID=363259 RepID=UPI0003661CFF|nr:ATP-binding protein [Kaistia granuli]
MQILTAAAGDSQTKASSCAGAEERGAAADRFLHLRALAAASADGENALGRALLADYARFRFLSLATMPLLVPFAALAATIWVPLQAILLWVAPVALLHGLLAAACQRSKNPTHLPADLGRRKAVLIGIETACGLGWASLLALTATIAQGDAGVFLVATTLVAIAFTTAATSSLPAAGLAGSAPIVLMAVALFAMRHDAISLGLAALTLVAAIGCLAHSKRLHDTTRDFLAGDIDNHRLISELEAARARADAALVAADEANLAKSRFLATMNHELRTPLNAILGFSEVMKDELFGPLQNRTYRDYARDIHQSGSHLLSLISEILELSGFEAGRYELKEEPVRLVRLVEECQAFVQSRAHSRDLTLRFAAEPDMPPLLADARGTWQVVINLLSNAIKFTPAGGAVEIRVGWTAGGGQYVSVLDNGPGIAAEDMPNLQTGFGRGEAGIRRAEQGSGMGLAIVEAITRLHGGSFELLSTPGRGTEATVCFPRARVMEPNMVSPVVAEPADVDMAAAESKVVLLRSAG